MVLNVATQEAVWLNRFLSGIKAPPQMPISIKDDNQKTIGVARNQFS